MFWAMTLYTWWDIDYRRNPCPDNIRDDDVPLKAHKDNYVKPCRQICSGIIIMLSG
jgi:hypothetical protein